MAEAKTTTDHTKIKKWVEDRGGHPARVRGTGDKDGGGLLRIDYPGYSGEKSCRRSLGANSSMPLIRTTSHSCMRMRPIAAFPSL